MAQKIFEDIEFHGSVEVKQGIAIDKPVNGVKKYVAKVTQSSTNDPVATIFENSLGGVPVWTRSGAGSFNCTLAGAFAGSVVAFVSQDFWATGNFGNGYREVISRSNSDSLILKQISNVLAGADGFTMYVEVTVYP